MENTEQQIHSPAGFNEPISVGNWILLLIISAIPLINIIMFFVWGFGAGENPVKANWAKANLLLWLIAAILGLIFFVFSSMLVASALY